MQIHFLGLMVAASGCATLPPSLDDVVLARVNGEPLTVQDLDDAFESRHQGHTVLLAGAGAVRSFLDKTIDRRLLVQEGRRIGLDQGPAIRRAVDAQEATRARDQRYKDEVSRPPEIPEAAVRAAYDKIAVSYRVRHILTYSREDAEQALARIRAGEAFGAVANAMSVGEAASKGGDLGFVVWGQLDPVQEAAVEAMRAGDLRGPLETSQGWNVLFLEEIRPWAARPELDKMRHRIRVSLSQRAIARRSVEYFETLRSRWKTEVVEAALTEENLLGQGPGPERAAEIVVARAGERTVSLANLRGRLDPEAARRMPRPWALKQIRGILDDLVFGLLLEQEALRRGYASRPEIAKEVQKLEEALVFDALLSQVIYPRVQVGDAEVRAFYDANPAPFTEPEAVRVSLISLEGRAAAEALLNELQAGADFATLARQRSRDPLTASTGGEFGWLTRGSADPAIETAAFALSSGELGIAERGPAAFVIKVEARRPARVQDFSLVKEKAREMLLRQRRREETNRWVARLREASEIAIDEPAIARTVILYEERAKARAEERGGKQAQPAPSGRGGGSPRPHP